MWAKMILCFLVLLTTSFSSVAMTATIEEDTIHYSNSLDNDFQQENGKLLAIVNYEIEGYSSIYLRKKSHKVDASNYTKNELPIFDVNSSSKFDLEYILTIGLKLPSHSIGYPFHIFL